MTLHEAIVVRISLRAKRSAAFSWSNARYRGSVQSGFPLFEAQPQPAEHPFEWPWVQDDFSRPAVANEDVANEDVANEDVEPRRRARR